MPSIAELRASQKKGSKGEGMNETDCRDLNATQGHKVDIKEFTDAERRCGIIRRGMMNKEDATLDLLDRVSKEDWPETPILD